MNDETGLPAGSAPNHISVANDTATGRQRTTLVIRLPLESYPRTEWQVESYEDERRLVMWLQRSDTLPMLASWLEGIVSWVDEAA